MVRISNHLRNISRTGDGVRASFLARGQRRAGNQKISRASGTRRDNPPSPGFQLSILAFVSPPPGLRMPSNPLGVGIELGIDKKPKAKR
jgi:hypothetical protein